MFDTTYKFTDLPIFVNGEEVTSVCGTAALEEDRYQDAGFSVRGIELDAKNPVQINATSDDQLARVMYARLASQIEHNAHARAEFAQQCNEFHGEAA